MTTLQAPTPDTVLAGPPPNRAATGLPIEVGHLTKRYGARVVVDDLSFTAAPGTVTGFLGPNGSGKSTTMKILLGLATADAGVATIGARRYRALSAPTSTVGAIVEPDAFHPGRSGAAHLRIVADAAGIPPTRIGELLERFDLTHAARRRVGTYSLGMRQRLGLAVALLGQPPVLVLDEPGNGLDPHGIHELRELLRAHAANGGTVFLSSHLLAEIELLAEHVVVIHQGRLVTDAPLASLRDDATLVRTDEPDRLASALRGLGADVNHDADGALVVRGLTTAEIGERAFVEQCLLRELAPHGDTLERRFLDWTSGTSSDTAAADTADTAATVPATTRNQSQE